MHIEIEIDIERLEFDSCTVCGIAMPPKTMIYFAEWKTKGSMYDREGTTISML